MTQLKNILVAIDFSTNSHKVFELGHSLAKDNCAHLHLIHVIDSVYYKYNSEISENEFIHKIRFENAKEELRKFKFEVPHSGVEIIEILIEGIPHEEIMHYARQNDIDMIVIASHGWTNLPHVVMGNIADKIMRQTEIPVICIKSDSLVTWNREKRKRDIADN
jgi:nucleotide-binding universal stress UspA family protein